MTILFTLLSTDNLVYINNAYSEDISQITRNELPAHEPAEHNGGSKKSEVMYMYCNTHTHILVTNQSGRQK